MQFTHKLFFTILSLLLFFVLSTVGSLAQTTNNPNSDVDANACFSGGSLYDTCNTSDVNGNGRIDETDQDWMWVCGWFLIRVEYGLFSADMLDGICLDIIEEVIEEEIVVKSKKKTYKCNVTGPTTYWIIYKADSDFNGIERIETVTIDPDLTECISYPRT
jgi:hypothetical protein